MLPLLHRSNICHGVEQDLLGINQLVSGTAGRAGCLSELAMVQLLACLASSFRHMDYFVYKYGADFIARYAGSGQILASQVHQLGYQHL